MPITIELSDDRSERVKQLKKLYKEDNEIFVMEKTVDELKSLFLEKDVVDRIAEFNLPKVDQIDIGFYSESNDEGGTYKALEYFTLYSNGLSVDDEYEDATWEESYTDYKGKDVIYNTSVLTLLNDWIHDTVSNYSKDLFEYYGWEVSFDLSEVKQ